MYKTSAHHRPAAQCDTRILDRLDDRQLADIGFDRQGNLITDSDGRVVRRLPQDVGFERALWGLFSTMHGAFARPRA